MSGDIPSYPRVILPLDGSEMVLGFQNGRTIQMRVSEVGSSGLITAVEAVGLQTARRISQIGDVTHSVLFDGRADATGFATISPKAVTNSKLADVGAFTLKGAMVQGSPVDLNMDQVTDMILAPLFKKVASTNTVTATEDLAAGNFVNIYDNGGIGSVRKAFGGDPLRSSIGFVRANYTAGSRNLMPRLLRCGRVLRHRYRDDLLLHRRRRGWRYRRADQLPALPERSGRDLGAF